MAPSPKIKIAHLRFAYGREPVLDDLSVEFDDTCITAIVGPSGQGKSTFLTVLNRLWEETPGARMSGDVSIRFKNSPAGEFQDIYAPDMDLHQLRRLVGMVFQIPNPLPMGILKNVAFPLKLRGETNRDTLHMKAEQALKDAFLWNEVKDRLHKDARTLSGGQQQRLCIARAIVLEPEVLLLDEPTASLDERSRTLIEALLLRLKERCAIIMVSHYLDQVNRIADRAHHMQSGKFIEHEHTHSLPQGESAMQVEPGQPAGNMEKIGP